MFLVQRVQKPLAANYWDWLVIKYFIYVVAI